MGADRVKPGIKSDGDGSSTGKRLRIPPADWLGLLLGSVLLTSGVVMVFGLGIGLIIFGAAIMVLAVIS